MAHDPEISYFSQIFIMTFFEHHPVKFEPTDFLR